MPLRFGVWGSISHLKLADVHTWYTSMVLYWYEQWTKGVICIEKHRIIIIKSIYVCISILVENDYFTWRPETFPPLYVERLRVRGELSSLTLYLVLFIVDKTGSNLSMVIVSMYLYISITVSHSTHFNFLGFLFEWE